MNPDPSGRRGILAGGNWIVDRPKIIDVYPVQDSLANILCETSSNGGSPYNVLIDVASDWVLTHGMECGGWCPKGRKAEDGPIDPKVPAEGNTFSVVHSEDRMECP